MKYSLLCFTFLTLLSCAYTIQPQRLEPIPKDKEGYDPYYTGPLISPSASNLPKGGWDLQPYVYFKSFYGQYDKHWKEHSKEKIFTIEEEIDTDWGITNWLEASLSFLTTYNKIHDHSIFNVEDLGISLRFQLLRSKKDTNLWNILFVIGQNFPTGKYQHLSKDKSGIDGTGSGAYQTGMSLRFSKIFFWFPEHPINFRTAVGTSLPIKTHVKGYNSYGGGIDTNGKITLDPSFRAYMAFEYSFTQRWVFAFDTVYKYDGKAKFQGEPGFNQDGSIASNGSPASQQISLAPAIEYNFSENLGIIGGAWFTVAGKNSNAFASGVISVSYVY